MEFRQAYEALKQGADIKREHWAGFWRKNLTTIHLHCKDGKIIPFSSADVFFTIDNILADDWIVNWNKSTGVELNISTFTFGEAIRRLKKGEKVARKGWNGKGMFVFLHEGYDTNENNHFTGNKHDFMNPYFCIKNVDGSISTWVPSVNDCLVDDWMVVEQCQK